MLTLSGLGDAYADCTNACDSMPTSTQAEADAYGACYANCANQSLGPAPPQATTSLPAGTSAQTAAGLPAALAPPPGYVASTPTNWWRIGIGVAVGLVGLGIVLGIHSAVKGAAHHAA